MAEALAELPPAEAQGKWDALMAGDKRYKVDQATGEVTVWAGDAVLLRCYVHDLISPDDVSDQPATSTKALA
jgi:hypothetical protein